MVVKMMYGQGNTCKNNALEFKAAILDLPACVGLKERVWQTVKMVSAHKNTSLKLICQL